MTQPEQSTIKQKVHALTITTQDQAPLHVFQKMAIKRAYKEFRVSRKSALLSIREARRLPHLV